MLPRNLNLIVVVAIVSLFCHSLHRQTRRALVVGEAIDLIDRYYVEEVESDDLLLSAMQGVTADLDEHSQYIPAKAFDTFQDQISQEFAGIGIYVDQPNENQPVRVLTPLVGSPALAAGLLPGDLILQVDDEKVGAMNIQDVSDRLRGPIGTTVRLLVGRDEEELPITVKRARIELESVLGDHRGPDQDWIFRLKSHPNIAYIRMTSFGEKTVQELGEVLADLNNEFEAIVLDLRGNGGGLLDAAAKVVDMFIDEGQIVSTRLRDGSIEDEFTASAGTLVAKDKPMAVLIDQESASASEIVAAALQDHSRAVVAGTRSYGKGTVQHVLPLEYGRSALRLTVAKYYRPSGKNIHRSKDATDEEVWGVSPDEGMSIAMDEATQIRLAQVWREASYPLLKDSGVDDLELQLAEDASDEAQAIVDGLNDNEKLRGLDLDQQLRIAVERLNALLGDSAVNQPEAKKQAA
ncbi:MAG: S41 family peptidase [Planctomycetota bacterium]